VRVFPAQILEKELTSVFRFSVSFKDTTLKFSEYKVHNESFNLYVDEKIYRATGSACFSAVNFFQIYRDHPVHQLGLLCMKTEYCRKLEHIFY
jgi:hypothetical protein